jgi:hypothetical protein
MLYSGRRKGKKVTTKGELFYPAAVLLLGGTMLTRILILTLFLAAACTPGPVRNTLLPQDTAESATSVFQEPSEATPVPSPLIAKEPSESAENTFPPSPAAEDGLQKKLTGLTVDDLATRLRVDAKEIDVTSTESIVWPNAALGCPLPNKVYTQGKIHGFRIWLKVNGQIYEYHTDRTGKIVLCLEPEVKPDEPGLR